MNTVLVTGATGNVGSHVVRELLEHGLAVRAFVRDPAKARALFGDAVERAVGDFGDRQSIDAAFDGVDRVFLSCANNPRQVEYESNVIDAATAAGVRRIVKLSAIAADPNSEDRFAAWQGLVEQHLQASGLPAVILRAGFYMTNLFFAAETIAGMGKLFAPANDAKIAMVDRRDLASVAALGLSEDGHDGRTYAVTGPEALTYHDAAKQLSVALDKPVEFIDVPDEAARDAAVKAGAPEWFADGLIEVFRQLRRGTGAQTTDVVRVLTGREPHSFAEFARDHAAAFRRGMPAP